MHLGQLVHFVAGLRTSFKIIGLLGMALGIPYILTLFNALRKCSVPSRTMWPGLVWLMLIPLFNIIWQFFVVLGLAQSLGNEFLARRIPGAGTRPGISVGIALCVSTAGAILPMLLFFLLCRVDNQAPTTEIGVWAESIPLLFIIAMFSVPAYLVLWTIYWNRIARFSRMLNRNSAVTIPASLGPRP